jgi:peptide/nickel transport system substrate-binding protein
VRQAIAVAIDRRALVQFRGATAHREARSVVPIGNLGFAEDLTLVPPIRRARARSWRRPGFPTASPCARSRRAIPGCCRSPRRSRASCGAPASRSSSRSSSTPLSPADPPDLSPVTLYQAARFPVADFYLTHFYYSRSIVGTPTAITNFSHCNVADAEIEAARTETDPARQRALWREAQVKILAALCGVPMF